MPSESIIMILGACLTALMQRASQGQSCQLEGGESWALHSCDEHLEAALTQWTCNKSCDDRPVKQGFLMHTPPFCSSPSALHAM